MNLNISSWGNFKISELFPVLQNGKANQGMLSDGYDCFYVGTKKDDNGVMLHCAYDSALIQKGNCIIFICNGQGSVGYANYMDVDFIGSTDIVAGHNKMLNQYNGLFIATVLCQERPKYSFGRKWKTHLKDTVIKLPQTIEGFPDWDFMEQYIKSLNHKPLTTQNKSSQHPLNIDNWQEFRLDDLFSEIYKAEAHVKGDLEFVESPGTNTIKFISRTEMNNGCDCYLQNNGISGIENGNAITIGDTTATCFYQKDEFVCGDHIVVCRAEWLNLYTGLFLVSLLKREKYKYNYGRAFKMDLISNTKVKLPTKSDGTPDFNYMEHYMKLLPYGDRI